MKKPMQPIGYSCCLVWLAAMMAAGCGGTAPSNRETPPCSSAIAYLGKPGTRESVPTNAWPRGDATGSDWLQREVPQGLANRLDEALQAAFQASGAVGLTAAVGVPGVGIWWRNVGLSQSTPAIPVTADSVFWWASVAKAYTAALVLQQIDRGTWSYDTSISRWWPSFPEARNVTLDHVLHHTSGVLGVTTPRSTPGPAPEKYHTPDELIADAATVPNAFCAGGYWSYSNVGYMMLGRALELSEGVGYGTLMTNRVFKPLGLRHTGIVAQDQRPSGLVREHANGLPADNPALATPFSAGNIAARADDVIRFWHARLEGLITERGSAQGSFRTLYPMFGRSDLFYGRGVMVMDWTDEHGRARTWLGHAGGTERVDAIVAYDAVSGAYVAVALNSKQSSAAFARELLKAVETRAAP